MKIVTHNARFHTDDVFAVATLLLVYPDAEIVRTRDKEIIQSADIVVDVGEIYDPEKNRFDHHQVGGAGVRENGIPYASFGLVWRKFGPVITNSPVLAEKIDKALAQPIDCPDNGIDVFTPKFPGIFPLTVWNIINTYSPTWKEPKNWDKNFEDRVKWTRDFLERRIQVEKDMFEAEEMIRKTYSESPNKSMVMIDEKYDFGRQLVSDILIDYPEPIYAILYRDDHKNWQIVAIRQNHDSFALRKKLPEAWLAKHDEELEKATGVEGSLFCHRSGFMCTASTKESAVKLAEIALNT